MSSLSSRLEEQEKGPGFSRLQMLLSYHEIDVLISGRVQMMSSKLHGLLYDVAIQCYLA